MQIFELRDASMEDARDVAAQDAGLNFIGLDGNNFDVLSISRIYVVIE